MTEPYIQLAYTQVRDKVTTAVVTATFGDRAFSGSGASVCDDHDDPDSATGAQLALGRALADLARKIKRDAWGRARA